MSVSRQRGFTRVELLVVVVLILILTAILLPAIPAEREDSRRLQCSNNLKQIGLALTQYCSAHGGFPAGGCNNGLGAENISGLQTWRISILPYMEQRARYDAICTTMVPDFFPGGTQPGAPDPIWAKKWVNLPAQKQVIDVFQCPSDPMAYKVQHHYQVPYFSYASRAAQANLADYDAATANYFGNAGPTIVGVPSNAPAHCALCVTEDVCACVGRELTGGSWYGSDPRACVGAFCQRNTSIKPSDITDGLGQTLLVGEEKILMNPAHPMQIADQMLFGWLESHCLASTTRGINGAFEKMTQHLYYAQGFGSYHPGGANFVFADGAYHFLSEKIDLKVLAHLGTRAGADAVPPGSY